MLALGQMTVILTKCIDLSVAANLALTGMVVAMLNAACPGVPVVALIVLAVVMGAALGAINGLLVWKLDIPPIVVTLGTLTIYRGIIFLISGGEWINAHEMSPAFKALPRAVVLGLPVLSWIAVAVIVARLAARRPHRRSAAPSTPSAATRTRRSTPASTSAAPASPPSSSPAPSPASAATSGSRATPSPTSTSPPASSST